ncbi:hypothetical protein MTR67_030025 [Solanum verrucosum]|uniref:Peptidase A1 domain-containing protein n=1 Tax=Solanum verrucosum TaxID=315347 RepID=A0AAF0U0J7_SOLVR|nr:hypothetical protein MTR67_030025 [Solanum verrucosum]
MIHQRLFVYVTSLKSVIIDAPISITHFTNVDLELSPSSPFAQVEEGLVCLTILPADEIAIFGNLAQGNFLIGYDLEDNKVFFAYRLH